VVHVVLVLVANVEFSVAAVVVVVAVVVPPDVGELDIDVEDEVWFPPASSPPVAVSPRCCAR